MPRREDFLQSLLTLHQLSDPTSLRVAWRGGLVALAQSCASDRPSPFEGLAPNALVASVQAAFRAGIFDDLEWLSPESAATVLYELASALPAGAEKRDLGKRVLSRFYDGNAATFVAIATRMALGAGKGFTGEGVYARLALAAALPTSLGVRMDVLALALVSRRELARAWVMVPAAGPLPGRRLAGRLLEHAAHAVAQRVAEGDESALRVMGSDTVAGAFERLLADREPLVWRHAAIARGLLSPVHPPFAEAVAAGFNVTLGPTEWRRSMVSLVASAMLRPEAALRKIRELVAQGFLARDPGMAATLLWPLPLVADGEPEVAEEILDLIVGNQPLETAEALVETCAAISGSFGATARAVVLNALDAVPPSTRASFGDDAAVGLRARVAAELAGHPEAERPVLEGLRAAVRSYAERGARHAHHEGVDVLLLLDSYVQSLDTLGAESNASDVTMAARVARRTELITLRDVDAALLEDGLLACLVALGGRAADEAAGTLQTLLDRTTEWVLEREENAWTQNNFMAQPTIRTHQLRTILHLADASGPTADETEAGAQRIRQRLRRIARSTLGRLRASPPVGVRRLLLATFARACDALVRDDTCDPADVVLIAAVVGLGADDVTVLAEASMDPDLRPPLMAFAKLLRDVRGSIDDSTTHDGDLGPLSFDPSGPSSLVASENLGRASQPFESFVRSLDVGTSGRLEAVRTALGRLGRALSHVRHSPSLEALVDTANEEMDPFLQLQAATDALNHLCRGAQQRFEQTPLHDEMPAIFALLRVAINGVLRAESANDGNTDRTAAWQYARTQLVNILPAVFAGIISDALRPLLWLPLRGVRPYARIPESGTEPSLPAWMPPRRILGGFYIVRPLGKGSGGTVFLVRRREERHDPHAEVFALKVPDYDANAARTLSEVEFLQLFRDEASALLGLPHHPNLARFVTFDLAARPKPILVMELVEGVSVERLLMSRQLTVARALELLQGLGEGLEAMHAAGVGHLDVKPSNVILREGGAPILVDFGLSGRRVRPGCATGPYGAPEVWGVAPHTTAQPAAVDVYAFGCFAFEVLTGRVLFDAPSEMALIAAHLTHDGWPQPLLTLSRQPSLKPVAEWMATCLRHEPTTRASLTQVRESLRSITPSLASARWPLG